MLSGWTISIVHYPSSTVRRPVKILLLIQLFLASEIFQNVMVFCSSFRLCLFVPACLRGALSERVLLSVDRHPLLLLLLLLLFVFVRVCSCLFVFACVCLCSFVFVCLCESTFLKRNIPHSIAVSEQQQQQQQQQLLLLLLLLRLLKIR